MWSFSDDESDDEESEDLLKEIDELVNTNELLMEAFRETGRTWIYCEICRVRPGNSLKNYIEHIRGWNHRAKAKAHRELESKPHHIGNALKAQCELPRVRKLLEDSE